MVIKKKAFKESFLIKFLPDLVESGKAGNQTDQETQQGQPGACMQPLIQVNSSYHTHSNGKPYLNTNAAIGNDLSDECVFLKSIHCGIKIKDSGYLIMDTGSNQ